MAGKAGLAPDATTRRVEGGAEYVNKNLSSVSEALIGLWGFKACIRGRL